MITNFKQYNESIKSLLVGPTKEEIWNNYMNGDLKGLLKSVPTSPEDFFNQMKEGCEIITKDGKTLMWGKKNIILFYQDLKSKVLYINYNLIWSIFSNIYGLSYKETELFINNLLVDDIKWNGYKIQMREYRF